MDALLAELAAFLGDFLPYLLLAAVLAAIVVALNVLGRRLEKHADLIAALDVRVHNLDKSRRATWARHLARPFGAPPELKPIVPPPLPPRAPTLGAIDWEEELVDTEEMMKKETGRYPSGIPPKGPNDDEPK